MPPSAKIITDSVSLEGYRVTTFEVVMHRYVLAEFNTHRVFSRNSASSRAIPLSKQLARIENESAVPLVFPKEQSGMQGGDPLDEESEILAYRTWIQAAFDAIRSAKRLGEIGVHKSVVNRLLEPFMYHTAVVTSTAWENFFGLRCNPMAQPEIRAVAELMQDAYKNSTPKVLIPGEWHLPYVQPAEYLDLPIKSLIKLSAARCARVSYLTQAGTRDVEKDYELYFRLISADPMHASPLEHVATPNADNAHDVKVCRLSKAVDGLGEGLEKTLVLPKYGNLLGWHQHRFDVEILRGYQAFS